MSTTSEEREKKGMRRCGSGGMLLGVLSQLRAKFKLGRVTRLCNGGSVALPDHGDLETN